MNQLSPWRIRRLARNEDIQPEFVHVSEPDEVPLSHYWKILVKRRNIILPIFFVVFAAGAYFALSATTLYTATARLNIEPQNPRVTGVGELQPLESGESRPEYGYHETQFALLQSRPLAARVISDSGLAANKAFTDAVVVSPNPVDRIKWWVSYLLSYVAPIFKTKSKTEDFNTTQESAVSGKLEPELSVSPYLMDQYLGFLVVEPIRQTRLVSVQFTTPNPSLSQALANAHVQTFLRMSRESRFTLNQDAWEFLDQRKKELQQKLERSEAELNRFRRAHGVVSVEKGENIVVDRLVDLNKQLTAARAQRIEAESLYRTVENKNYQDLAEIMRQGLIQQLKSNLANVEAEKARSTAIFKPDHPRIQELDHQIAAARRALNDEIAHVVRGISSSYAAALAKERALEKETDKQQGDALQLRELGVQYTVLQEDVNANRSLYESVLKRLSETNVSNDVAVSNLQIVEKAAKPLSTSGPNVSLYLMASIASGLFLGVSAALLREMFHSTVSTPEEVWRSVGLATLGAVPNLKSYSGTQIGGVLARHRPAALASASCVPAKELITNHSPLSIVTEAYRTVRTSLLLSQPEKPPKVILLTSPSPAEGKTVTTLNLAIALAQHGHKVLVIDADLRKGCCHVRLGMQNQKGLSNILTGNVTLEESVLPTSVSRLSLLSRGIRPPNPTDLLGSAKMREILGKLRESFNFILIDSPPAIAVSDAAVLSVLCDGVLLVFHGQETTTVSARQTMERLDAVRAPFMGVILNGIDLRNPEYAGYRHYYGSDYAVGKSGDGDGTRAPAHANEERDDDELRFEDLGPGTVPQYFFDRMVHRLSEAAGPMAPLIIQGHIARLGASRAAFPRNRLKELLELVSQEIASEQLRDEFCQRMRGDLTTL